MKHRILVVDDETPICDLLKISLEAEGYEVDVSNDGKDALAKISALNPDLLILDLMLPEINGFEICKKVTAERPIPIIMLTAKTDLVDKVLGLELGADDYMTKPFHTRELLARVKALLRRTTGQAQSNDKKPVTNGCLEIYHDRRSAVMEGKELELSAKEYDLLYFLTNHLEQVFSRDALLENVWGYDFAGDTRTVDVHIQRLRRKLGDDHKEKAMINTVFGVGYKMKKQS